MGKNRILKYIFAYNTEIKETMATLAYLIGNSKYTYLTQLENPENDAKELAEKLNSLGITTKTFYNQCGSEYAKILSTLEKDIKDYDDIIFYYAGHAFQIKDENYLAGIDLLNVTSLPDEREKIFLLKRASLLLSEVLEIFKEDKQTIPAGISLLRIVADNRLSTIYGFKAMPTIYLLDKENKVILKDCTPEQLMETLRGNENNR